MGITLSLSQVSASSSESPFCLNGGVGGRVGIFLQLPFPLDTFVKSHIFRFMILNHQLLVALGFEYRICIDDLQGGLVLRSVAVRHR